MSRTGIAGIHRLIIAGSAISLLLLLGLQVVRGDPNRPVSPYFLTNDEFITGIHTSLDLRDPKKVFEFVFSRLPDHVTVYPSENYYYFKFAAQGKTVNGSITLYAYDRDRGVLGFGYVEKLEDKARQRLVRVRGDSHEFTADDGLAMHKVDSLEYDITYQGRTVRFSLFDLQPRPPKKGVLREDETYVGPSFDESGLRFHLIFNRDLKRLYWILDEETFVSEIFVPLTKHVVLGARTGFAFFDDTLQHRKVLVGVDGLNVLQNNWYDGPFDQMPDNLVQAGKVRVKEYLLAHYRLPSQAIDDFGRYVGERGSRVPVAPYRVYFSTSELRSVDSCVELNLSRPQLYGEITKQIYNAPKEYLP